MGFRLGPLMLSSELLVRVLVHLARTGCRFGVRGWSLIGYIARLIAATCMYVSAYLRCIVTTVYRLCVYRLVPQPRPQGILISPWRDAHNYGFRGQGQGWGSFEIRQKYFFPFY